MILNHVADCAGLIAERSWPLDSKILCHRDLHAFDLSALPERLQKRVLEAEEHHIMHRPLAEVMVDAKDRRLVEGTEAHPVEFLCGGAVVTEGFFNDDASAFGAVRLRQLFYDQPEQRRWDGEVVRRPLRGAQLLADGLKGRRVLVVAVHIVEVVLFSFWFVL